MRKIAPLLLLTLLAACGDRDDRLESWVGIDGPRVVGNRVVYLDRNFDEAVILAPAAGVREPDWERVALSPGVEVVAPLAARKQLLLANRKAGLIDLLEVETGKLSSVDINGSYDRYVVLADPPFLGAHYSSSAGGGESDLFLNQGEVAFVDLAAAKPEVFKVVLKTYGGAPIGLDIAPRVPYAGGERMLAFVRWNSYLSIVDCEDEKFKSVAIPLKAPDSDLGVIPGPLQFVAGNDSLSAYFLAQGTSDLYSFDLVPSQMKGGSSGLVPNVFPAAAGASSFSIFRRSDGSPAIAVLSPATRTVSIIYPDTSDVKQYQLEGMTPTNLEIFSMVSTETGNEEEFAFIYNTGGPRSYYFVELHRLAEKKSKAFHRYATLPAGVRKVYMMGDDEFLVMHDGGSSPMSLVAVADGSVVSVGGNLSVTQETFSVDGGTMYALATKGSTRYLVAFDLATLQARELDLSHGQAPERLAMLADSGLLLTWDNEGRVLTVVPESFKKGDSKAAVQFFLPFLNGLEH